MNKYLTDMMTSYFMSLSTLFKSYEHGVRVMMKRSVQRKAVQSSAVFCLQRDSNPGPCDQESKALTTLPSVTFKYLEKKKKQHYKTKVRDT